LILLKLVVSSAVKFSKAWDCDCLIFIFYDWLFEEKNGVVAAWCVDINSSGWVVHHCTMYEKMDGCCNLIVIVVQNCFWDADLQLFEFYFATWFGYWV